MVAIHWHFKRNSTWIYGLTGWFHFKIGQKQRLWFTLLGEQFLGPVPQQPMESLVNQHESYHILQKKTPCNPYYNETPCDFFRNLLSRVSTFAGLVWWACCACNSCGCLEVVFSRGCCSCFMIFMYFACSMQSMACIRPFQSSFTYICMV